MPIVKEKLYLKMPEWTEDKCQLIAVLEMELTTT